MSTLSAKTPRLRGGSKGRRRFTPPATKAQAAAAAGISPSGELSQKLEHVTLFSYFDDDRPTAAHKPFEELLDDESHGSAPAPPPPPPVDADVAMEDRDCCILSQDFFW
jgi:wee1-like protein kinase